MNFLATLLYIAVNDEVIAFAIMTKIMFEFNWRDVYSDNMIGLLDVTKKVNHWLKKEHKATAHHLDINCILLEVQLSSPVLCLFANLVPIEVALKFLDRFIMYGERGVLSII